MKKVLCACTLLFASLAHADVFFQPATQTVNVGQTVTVAAMISGVTNPWLGSYDVTFTFDPTILQFSVASMSNTYMGSWIPMLNGGPAGVQLAAVSMETTAMLGTLQSGHDPFELGTATFLAIAPGTSALTFSAIVLGDGNGDPIAMAYQNGSVTVNGGIPGVPEPTAGLLFLIPAALVAARLRARRV